MHLQQLFYLLEVGKTHSISQAAENLFITQPTLSIAISNLEKELGCTLLNRTKSGVYPTEAGKKAICIASEITSKIGELERLGELESKEFGINVFSIPSLNSGFLQEALIRFHQLCPSAQVNVFEEKPPIALACYMKEIAHLEHPHYYGILAATSELIHSIHKRTKIDIESYLLRTDEMCCLIGAFSPLANADTITIEQFLEYPLIQYQFMPHSSNPFYKDAVILEEYDAIFKQGKTCLTVASLDVLKQLVANNIGISAMPKSMLHGDENFMQGKIKILPFEDFHVPLEYYLIHPKNYVLTDTEKTFIDVIQKVFEKQKTE